MLKLAPYQEGAPVHHMIVPGFQVTSSSSPPPPPTPISREMMAIREQSATLFNVQTTWRNSPVWAVNIPQFRYSEFSPWPVNQLHVVLASGPLTPTQKGTSFLWTMIDRTGLLESSLLCCCVTPQLLFSLRLGWWPSESGTSEIVAKRGQNHSCRSQYIWV